MKRTDAVSFRSHAGMQPNLSGLEQQTGLLLFP